MKRIRMIPVLLLQGGGLYKTVRFKNPKYVGDPINTVKLFNEKGADELVVLDIVASRQGRPIDFKKVAEMANEAFMPLAYGGGIKTFEDAKQIFDIGCEKIVLNSNLLNNPDLIGKIASTYGSQSVVASIDAKKGWWGGASAYTQGGTKKLNLSPVALARQVEQLGAGEILVNSIVRDGTWEGYDLDLIRSVSTAVQVPVIACGGAGSLEDFRKAVTDAGASAVAAGSLFVYQKKDMGVLINFPSNSLKV